MQEGQILQTCKAQTEVTKIVGYRIGFGDVF